VEVVLPCNNNTTLTFEYKPDENKQMRAYLTINKNDVTIPFMFPFTEYREKVDGQLVTNIMQTGLIKFHLILGCYLAGKSANGDYFHELYNEAIELACQPEQLSIYREDPQEAVTTATPTATENNNPDWD
jgi:hypothetical protein